MGRGSGFGKWDLGLLTGHAYGTLENTGNIYY